MNFCHFIKIDNTIPQKHNKSTQKPNSFELEESEYV